jgi:hypothetical protein
LAPLAVSEMAETRNIFVVHAHTDDELVPKLKELIERSGMTVRNGSIDGHAPNEANSDEYIKQKYLRPHIDWASVVVVLITDDTAQSSWVDWEIKYAASRGKHIVGVYAHGATDADLPEELTQLPEAPIVGWQSERIALAIEGKIAGQGSLASDEPDEA